MNSFSFSIPQNILVGPGTLGQLPRFAGEMGGTKALIISGPSLAKNGLVGRAAEAMALAGIGSDVFTEIEANPCVETVERATKAYQRCGADFIVALGGGSPMDVAKAVAVIAKYGGSITEYEGAHKVPGKVVPMIAIPTTAGTGSEVTAFSVITDHSRNYKFTIFSYELLPQYAILDPELIATVPPYVAAACGIDAFIHAMEAYLSLDASPFTEAMSEKAMDLIGGAIRCYVANRRDERAAGDMLTGSLMAGIAFSFARLGDIHAMSHPLSAYFDIPHGVANGVLLPTILAYNALANRGKYERIYQSIVPGNTALSDFEPGMLVEAVRKLLEDIGIPQTVMEAIQAVRGNEKITRSEVEALLGELAEDACKSGNIAVNPRTTTRDDVIALYQEAL